MAKARSVYPCGSTATKDSLALVKHDERVIHDAVQVQYIPVHAHRSPSAPLTPLKLVCAFFWLVIDIRGSMQEKNERHLLGAQNPGVTCSGDASDGSAGALPNTEGIKLQAGALRVRRGRGSFKLSGTHVPIQFNQSA